MITIVLDTNIYDKLEADQAMVEQINQLIAGEVINILMPRQVAEELRQRPAGIPELFPMTYTGHAALAHRQPDFAGFIDLADNRRPVVHTPAIGEQLRKRIRICEPWQPGKVQRYLFR